MADFDISQLMQQAQQMREQMEYMQKGLAEQSVEGSAGGGMVKVTMTGAQQVTAVKIDPAALEDGADMLPDLVAAARRDFLELHPDENMTWMTANFPEDFFDRLFRIMPLKDMPVVRHMPFWREMIENRDNPAYFDANAMKDKLSKVDVPVIHVNGWYDGFIRNTYEHYEGLVAGAATQEARDGQRLFIGPWSHGGCFECPPGGAVDGQQLMLAWMDQCFKGIRSPVFDAPVTIYVMG